ncbi:TPA: hypothetical protein ACWQUF_004819, partial [Salmonella enterica]
RLAAEPQTGRREVSALTDARKTLAYDFFRILRAPQIENILQLRSLDIADWMMSLENVSGLLGQKPVTK